MHFEFLVEDQSCKKAMTVLIPQILGDSHTFRIHAYRGIGHLPKDLRPKSGADKRILLDQLPRILRGYGKSSPQSYIVVICDLDDKNKAQFLADLNGILKACDPTPNAHFCLAVEELEAWYLGDSNAVSSAYPNVKSALLSTYVNDSICGTWERLADAIFKGGSSALKKLGWQAVGREKSKWATDICPHMDVSNNLSPSFNHMAGKLTTAVRESMPSD
jgi:hypothetical protein